MCVKGVDNNENHFEVKLPFLRHLMGGLDMVSELFSFNFFCKNIEFSFHNVHILCFLKQNKNFMSNLFFYHIFFKTKLFLPLIHDFPQAIHYPLTDPRSPLTPVLVPPKRPFHVCTQLPNPPSPTPTPIPTNPSPFDFCMTPYPIPTLLSSLPLIDYSKTSNPLTPIPPPLCLQLAPNLTPKT